MKLNIVYYSKLARDTSCPGGDKKKLVIFSNCWPKQFAHGTFQDKCERYVLSVTFLD